MLVLLIRHGQSRANVEGIIQGADDPLTDVGRAQAEALGQYLSENYSVTHVYASSLDRAAETAAIASAHIGVTPVVVDALAEIDAGIAAGRLWKEWREEDPARADRWSWETRLASDAWEGGECGTTFSTRVFAALDEIIDRHKTTSDTVAIITHGGVLSWFTARLHGDALDRWPSRHAGFTNCSVSELFVTADGSLLPGMWNVPTEFDDAPFPA